MSEVASAYKVTYHREKLEAYLRDERVYPVTLELDITTQCTRNCPDCPSSRSPTHQQLDLNFVRNLFAALDGQTKGLLVAGGEPTVAEGFPDILRTAREKGFEEIAVVSNGALIDEARVAESLMAHATSVRVSLYGWDATSCNGMTPTLRRLESLRKRIDRTGSPLEIGVSLLTSEDRTAALPQVADAARRAGADWVYFHPMCKGWGKGCPNQVDQKGVLQAIDAFCRSLDNGFGVYYGRHRYLRGALRFESYHAAHFLLVVGADGINYVGAEAKYQPHLQLCDIAGNRHADFLFQPQRLERIRRLSSSVYPGVGSRHRGILYNDLIDRLRRGELSLDDGALELPADGFRYPHIL